MKPVEAERALIVGLHSTLWDSYPVLKVSWKTKLSSSQKKKAWKGWMFFVLLRQG